MTENRTSSGGPQGQYSGGPQNEIERLANDPNISRHVWICQNPPGWDGSFYTRDTLNQFDYESAHYVSCALIRQGSTTRSNATFMAAWLFVLDDVCDVVLHVAGEAPKAIRRKDVDELIAFGFLPAASTIKETSAGNYQYQWRLALEHDFPRWNYFLIQCKGHKLIGPSLQQGDPVHYYRLGSGTNTKPGKNNFPTRMVKAYDGSVHKLDDIAAGLGIDMSPAAIIAWASAQAKSSPADETASDEAITEIMKLIPNDSFFDDRNRWAAIGFALKNASGDSPVIRELWIEWDNVTNGADAGRFWDTAHEPKAGLSTLRREIERRYGADSPQRQEVAKVLARGVFDKVDDAFAHIMPEKKPAAAEREIDKLLREIAKHQPTPQRHVELPDTQLDDVFDLMTQTQVDAPMIIAPYLRGKLSTIAGPPAKGKSLLLAQQCLAIALERPDLIRRGAERLQLPGDVLYFCNEDGKRIFTQRAAAWAKKFGVNPTGRRFKVIPVVSNLLRKEGDTVVIECIKLLEAVLEHIKLGRQIAMIAIDTVPASTEGIEENSAKEMGHVHRLLGRFASSFWAAVVMVTHTTKAAWEGDGRSMGSVRGSGATVGTSRGVVALGDPLKEESYPVGTIIEWVVKSSAGRQGYEACAYGLEVVEIDVEDAETPGLVISKGQPVLVPVSAAVAAFADEDELDRLRAELEGWLDDGVDVWVAAKGSTSGSRDALHNRWQKSATETEDIFSKMEKRDWFSRNREYDGHLKQKVNRVIRP